MVFEKYTKKDGKLYGPYLYENKRVGEKVVTKYVGAPKTKTKKLLIWLFLSIIALLSVVSIIHFLPHQQVSPTGNVAFDVNLIFEKGEPLRGDMKFNIKEGEFVPSDSVVIVQLGNQSKEFILSDLIIDSPSTGEFYAEDSDISGEGEGYGSEGEYTIYPTIDFKLRVGSEEDISTPSESNESTKGPSENESSESDTESETESSEDAALGTEDAESTSAGEIETSDDSSSEPESESSDSESSSDSGDSGDSGGVTGNVLAEGSYTIDAEVSKGHDFVYSLEEGQAAEIDSDSVMINGSAEDPRVLKLTQDGNNVRVSTDYFISRRGYGKEFLGDYALSLNVPMDELDLVAEEGLLNITLVYNGKHIASIERELSVTGEVNATLPLGNESGITLTHNIPDVKIAQDGEAQIDMENYFAGVIDGYEFTSSNISADFEGNVATIKADGEFTGTRSAKITAYNENGSIESNEFSVLVSSGSLRLVTSREQVRVGEPVKWITNVTLADVANNISVEIPASAEDVKITKIDDGSEENVDLEGSGNGGLLTGEVSIELQLEKESIFTSWLKKMFRALTGRSITGNVIADEESDSTLDTKEVSLEGSEANDTNYIVEYYTPGPTKVEDNLGNGKKSIEISADENLGYIDVIATTSIPKGIVRMNDTNQIVLEWRTEAGSIDSNVSYDSVKTSSDEVPESLIISDVSIGNNDSTELATSDESVSDNNESNLLTGNAISEVIVHRDSPAKVNSSVKRIDGTAYAMLKIPFTAHDNDNDGYADEIEWIVPHFSTQFYELSIGETANTISNRNNPFATLDFDSATAPYDSVAAYYSFEYDNLIDAYDVANGNTGVYSTAYPQASCGLYGDCAHFDGNGYINIGEPFENSVLVTSYTGPDAPAASESASSGNGGGFITTYAPSMPSPNVDYFCGADLGGPYGLEIFAYNVAPDNICVLSDPVEYQDCYPDGIYYTINDYGCPGDAQGCYSNEYSFYTDPVTQDNNPCGPGMTASISHDTEAEIEGYDSYTLPYTLSIYSYTVAADGEYVLSATPYNNDPEFVPNDDFGPGYEFQWDWADVSGANGYILFDDNGHYCDIGSTTSWNDDGSGVDCSNGSPADFEVGTYDYRASGSDYDGQFSVSAWVYSDDFDQGDYTDIVSKENEGYYGWTLRTQNGRPDFSVMGSGDHQAVDDETLSNSKWHHLVGTYDGDSTVRLYVDGELVASAFDASYSPSDLDTYIGAGPFFGRNFNGKVDDVIIFNTTLTFGQMQDLYNNASTRFASSGTAAGLAVKLVNTSEGNLTAIVPSSLIPSGTDIDLRIGYWNTSYGYNTSGSIVNYYHFDNLSVSDSDTYFTDAKSGSNVTCVGSICPRYTNDGVFGKALAFDGVDDYIQSPYTAVTVNDFTIAFWMKKASSLGNTAEAGNCHNEWYCGYGLVDAEVSGEANDFGVSVVDDRVNFGIGGPDRTIASSTLLQNDRWYFVTATRDQSTGEYKLYIDGVLENSDIGNKNDLSAPPDIMIGEDGQGNRGYFNGSLDEIMIYDSVLSDDQVRALYSPGLASWQYTSFKNLSNASTSNSYSSYCNSGLVGALQDSATDVCGRIGGTSIGGADWSTNDAGSIVGNFTGGYINLSSTSMPKGSNPSLTVSTWINLRSESSPARCFFGIGQSNTDNTHLGLCIGADGNFNDISGRRIWITHHGGIYDWDTGYDLPSGWNLVTYTSNSTTETLYINAIKITSRAAAYSIGSNPAAHVGRWDDIAGNLHTFNGLMDDFSIWNKTLTSTEIGQLYEKKQLGLSADFSVPTGVTDVLPSYKLFADSTKFYTPYVGLQLFEIQSSANAASSSGVCSPPVSGTWNLDCSQNCSFSSSINVPGDVNISGSGTINVTSSGQWTYTGSAQKIFIYPGCKINVFPGGKFGA